MSTDFETSVLIKITSPPAVFISSTVFCPPSSDQSATTTFAPSLANKIADAFPIPDPAPVTIATLSFNRIIPSNLINLLLLIIAQKKDAELMSRENYRELFCIYTFLSRRYLKFGIFEIKSQHL